MTLFNLATFALLLLVCGASFATQPTTDKKYSYSTKYVDIPVDQFSFSSNATFKLRYLVNDTWWTPQGPIFFYTGNEGDIELFAQNTGFMWDIASEFGALVVFSEHRYYGQSMPFGNASFADPRHLGFLTSAQAMEDFVDVIALLKADPKAAESPVVAFGGSYGGMLAAWFRMKYPHVVVGAIAGSAPILQFPGSTPCDAFGRIVTSDFVRAGSECAASIRKSWHAINAVSSTADGKAWLGSTLRLCKPAKSDADVTAVKSWLSDVYVNLAMVDYPYAANFLAPLPANPINEFCRHLKDSSLADRPLLEALQNAINVYANYTRTVKCIDVEQSSAPSLDDHGWDFQACTEMVMPMCYDGKKDMFEPAAWDFQVFSDGCFKRWGVRPDQTLIINRFGGRIKDLSTASNIVFSNGLLDPWSSGGVMKNLSATATAIIIPDGAHHLDLRGANPDDPESVKLARNFHRAAIKTWVRQARSQPQRDSQVDVHPRDNLISS